MFPLHPPHPSPQVYSRAYASKISEGEVFARHFAVIRERRYLAKTQAKEAIEVGRHPQSIIPLPPPHFNPLVVNSPHRRPAQHKPAEAPPGSKPLTKEDRRNVAAAVDRPPSPQTPTPAATPEPPSPALQDHAMRKRTPKDFVMLKPLGEGSYSTVSPMVSRSKGTAI